MRHQCSISGEEECAKTYTGAHASEECCNKGCMWGSCLSMVWNTKPVYHYVVGSFCTFNHGECNDITGAFCNTTENTATDITKALCECAAIYQPGKKGDVKCIARGHVPVKKVWRLTAPPKQALVLRDLILPLHLQQTPVQKLEGKMNAVERPYAICYELDSTMTAKCEEEAPDNKCRATNITTTLGPTDPCQAQSNQTACCGQTDDKCVFISCTGLDDQPHTGCHKNSTDYPAFCKDAATDMCKYGYETESIGEFQRNMKNALKYLNENMKGLQSGQEALVSRIEALEGGMTKMDRTVFGQGPDKGKKGRGNIQSDIDRLKKENRLMRKKTKALEKAVKVMMSLNKQKGA
ncbi:hypothetical protein MAR_017020 [Mya arenaria]|uniref:Disintegrin domain-containing protein n=1 Tax=Mya arenaria TaxID=6604 RepID=A0ABY7EE37_MYAAR|nr:hypothetical protein MAR_017020 [Mya arenaria]